MRFLFVDRIKQLIPGKQIYGIKHITREDTYLVTAATQTQFVSSFVGETLGQLAAWNVMYSNGFTKRPVAGIVKSVDMLGPVLAGETLYLEAFITALDDDMVSYYGLAWTDERLVLKIDGAIGPLLPMEQFIQSADIRSQFNQICLPEAIYFPEKEGNNDRSNAIRCEHAIDVPPQKQLPILIGKHFTFDNILTHQPGKTLSAEKLITRAAGYFNDHFPLKPVLPLTVLLECQLNLVQRFMQTASFSQSYTIKALRKIKMNEFVLPGDKLVSTLEVKRHDDRELILSCRSEVEGKRVCYLEIIMQAEG